MDSPLSSKPRSLFFDALRGLAIITIVCGHCSPTPLRDTVYLFHLQLFFFITGYFHVARRRPFANLAKKYQSIGFKSALFICAYFCCKNLLIKFKLIQVEALDLKAILESCINSLMLTYYDPFLGACWYIPAIIAVTTIFSSFTHFCYARKWSNELKNIILILLTIIASSCGVYFIEEHKSIAYHLTPALTLLPFLGLGFYAKKFFQTETNFLKFLSLKKFIPLAIIFYLILAYSDYYYSPRAIDIYSHRIYSAPFFYFISVYSILMVCYLVKFFSYLHLTPILAFIGRHTIVIMVYHLIFFRILFNVVNMYQPDQTWLVSSNDLTELNYANCFAYTLVGLIPPILISLLFNMLGKQCTKLKRFL